MKFYSDIPNLHIVRQRVVGNRQEGYLLCKFDENGELESNDAEVIRQLKNIYRHDEEEVKKIKPKTVKSDDGLKHCKKCEFTCETQGELMAHYKAVHPKPKKVSLKK